MVKRPDVSEYAVLDYLAGGNYRDQNVLRAVFAGLQETPIKAALNLDELLAFAAGTRLQRRNKLTDFSKRAQEMTLQEIYQAAITENVPGYDSKLRCEVGTPSDWVKSRQNGTNFDAFNPHSQESLENRLASAGAQVLDELKKSLLTLPKTYALTDGEYFRASTNRSTVEKIYVAGGRTGKYLVREIAKMINQTPREYLPAPTKKTKPQQLTLFGESAQTPLFVYEH